MPTRRTLDEADALIASANPEKTTAEQLRALARDTYNAWTGWHHAWHWKSGWGREAAQEIAQQAADEAVRMRQEIERLQRLELATSKLCVLASAVARHLPSAPETEDQPDDCPF